MSKINKIGVLCAYAFPEGMAPTIRIVAYCKGLQQNGVTTEVFTFKKTPPESTDQMSGEVQGIPYFKSYIKHQGGFIRAIIDKVSMLKRLYKQIKDSNQSQAFDYILLSFDTLDKFYTLVPLLKILGIRLVFIGDEFPEPIRRLKSDIPWWHKVAYRFIHKAIDGRILMTQNLRNFYDNKVSVKPTYILNSIVDEARFINVERQQVPQKYLCYMGNMELAKDNVDNIIRAFSKISQKYPDYEFWLYGQPSENDRIIIENLISEYQLNNKVYLKGRVDYNQVPQILANASILLTSQPMTKRAQGGFPTKMAEYMMSMTPMIVTNVGEIHKYVKDSETTFMVEPCDPVAYAEKISFILDNSSIAEEVANNAFQYAKLHFCSKHVTMGMIEFLNILKK